MPKTLVTGATGLVGYNILQLLLGQDRQVKALVRSLNRGRELLPEKVELVVGDITDADSIRTALQDCSVVYHAAGIPEQWVPNVDQFERVNVQGTQNVANAALSVGVEKFVYISTIDVFDAKEGESFDESNLANRPKETSYERSKQEADRRVVQAQRQGLPAIFIHPSAVYGPGPTSSPGVNRFFLQLAKGAVPMVPPGLIPLVFAPDVAETSLAAEQRAAIGDRFIVSESCHTFQDISKVISAELGLARSPVEMPLWMARAIASTGERWANIVKKPPLIHRGQLHTLQWKAFPVCDKAKRQLGWQPTDFEEGVRLTCRFLFPEHQPPAHR